MTCSPKNKHKGNYKAAVAQLQSAGYKMTKPRLSLLKAIAEFGAPFSAEEISKQFKKSATRAEAPDLVTIYRTLATFEELKIITRCDFGDGTIRYEMTEADGTHHHHVICISCKKIEPVEFCAMEKQEQLVTKMGYKGVSHKLEFFGLCPNCG